ncbi:SGNH/GDSL hydrolase family protein [Ekhidna sp.]|uniref:SGNH/GDSL hydrolase family protein n=1 Tax=Ekhidna sp. TaxID=2608089 RepID=UPI003B5062CD
MKRLVYCFAFLILSIQFVKAQSSKVLFVGNSLTYTNNLPELVEKEAKRQGIKVQSKMLAFPNYAIIDHWNDGEVQKLIQSEKYDYVVVQQGPSSQKEGRQMLIEDGARLQKLCAKHDAKLVYFMVWPSRTYYYTFEGVIKNHKDAADMNDALLCPVGEAWKAYFDRNGDFSLYGRDGFHPSPKGSRLAAKVIVDTLFENDETQTVRGSSN